MLRPLIALLLAAPLAAFSVVALSSEPGADDNPLAAARQARLANEAKIREALQSKISIELVDKPLNQAVPAMAAKAGLKNVRIDATSLMEEGIAIDEPITIKVSDATLASAFHRALTPFGLTSRIHDEMLVITTQVVDDDRMVHRFHDVRALRKEFAKVPDARGRQWRARRSEFFPDAGIDPGRGYPRDAAELVPLLEEETAGPWEEIDGSGGTVTPAGPSFVVRQTDRVQDQVAAVLRNLVEFTKREPDASTTSLPLSAAEEAVRRKHWDILGTTIGPLEFEKTPLKKVAESLSRMTGAIILLDETALAEEGVKLDEEVSFSSGKITFRSAAKTILDPFGLTLLFQDGLFKITTTVNSDEIMETILYDTRDLVARGVDELVLADLIESETEGPWERIDGSGGTISSPLPGALIVRQTLHVHLEISDFLSEVRETFREGKEPGAFVRLKESKDKHLVLQFYALDRRWLAAQMEQALVEFVEPESWTAGGGEGTLRRVDETLVVRQSPAVHRLVAAFLKEFKRAGDEPALTSPRRVRGF